MNENNGMKIEYVIELNLANSTRKPKISFKLNKNLSELQILRI